MDALNTGILAILGIGVFGGVIGAVLFQRLQIPQVVGYIAIGLIIGKVGLGLVDSETLESLQLLNLFALGIIGFLVGGELKLDVFRKQGKQLFTILVFEGVGAFILAGVPIALLLQVVIGDWAVSLAGGAVFGAIASATDPASTLNVLWEYRSRGVLTTTLIAIVALDDALAMMLYGIGTTVAQLVTGSDTSISEQVLTTGSELLGAVVVGAVAAVVLRYVVRYVRQPEKIFATSMGILLLVIGIAAMLQMDVILAAMTLGVTLTNIAPRESESIFKTIRSFAEPIYVIFFVMVGARLDVASMPGWLWGVVALYVAGRSVGKIGGTYVAGRLSGAAPSVQRYGGMGLFAQGGIAVGLSIMAAHHLGDVQAGPDLMLGDLIIFGVTASTLVLQVTGPPLIKLASRLAGELGKDVKEEDVIASWRVSDVMTTEIEPVKVNSRLSHVFQRFSEHDHLVYPVVDMETRLKGLISLDGMKNIITSRETWDWVLAADVMEPVQDRVQPETPLEDAMELMRRGNAEEIPVVSGDAEEAVVGMLDERSLRIRVSEETVKRRAATE